MAELYPFSPRTLERLRSGPEPGPTHKWIAQVACGLRHVLDPDHCFAFLRECCDHHVTHREVPDDEIEAAVDFAFGDDSGPRSGRQTFDWPSADPSLIARVVAETSARFDVEHELGSSAADILPTLFAPGELVCVGPNSRRALVRPLEDSLRDAHLQQFIVLNPMRGREAINNRGRPSVRCQNNVRLRRYLVAEFDDLEQPKIHQARFATWLERFAPLVLVVDSGGKSLHAWYRVDHLCRRDQARFFATACLLGADDSRWDICGWLRMPGGLRQVKGVPAIRQRILYHAPR